MPALDKTSIGKEELLQLPLSSFPGPIHLVDRDDAVPEAAAALARESLLGFDTETKPVFVRGDSHPPALVQLAGEQAVYIFQLKKLRRLDGLLDVLANRDIRKVGVALADDLKKLREFAPFDPAGFVEIGSLAQSLGIKQTGLRALAGLLLGIRISKREQRSNWARDELTRGQIAYAATDAWISRDLYRKLEILRLAQHSEERPLGSARDTMA